MVFYKLVLMDSQAAHGLWVCFWLRSSHYVNIVRFNEAGSLWSARTHSAFGGIMCEFLNLRGTSLGGITGQLPVSSLGLYCIITLDEGLA